MLKLGLPKGRMFDGVSRLLADAGLELKAGARDYRPLLPSYDVKVLKPQNIITMLDAGSRDVGFVGWDWVEELGATQLVRVFDTGLDPVRIVAAVPFDFSPPTDRPLVVTSEYERLTRRYLDGQGLDYRFVRSFGATEVFPPEDADMIVDNTATGATLKANGLIIRDEVLRSSTHLAASPTAWADPTKREAIENLAQLLRSVLDARGRVMLEANVPKDRLEAVVAVLPCMREPTIAPLAHDAGFAVKVAAPRADLPTLIPLLRKLGAGDIVVTRPHQIVS